MKNEKTIKLTGSQELQREKIDLLLVKTSRICTKAYLRNLSNDVSIPEWINGYKPVMRRADGRLQTFVSYNEIKSLNRFVLDLIYDEQYLNNVDIDLWLGCILMLVEASYNYALKNDDIYYLYYRCSLDEEAIYYMYNDLKIIKESSLYEK